LVPAADLLAALGPVPGLSALLSRLGIEEESPGLAAAALELALEGLHLNRRLAKDEVAGRTVYGR
ncbi:MAG: magnesium chelatase, partial [Frankiales bacterium]